MAMEWSKGKAMAVEPPKSVLTAGAGVSKVDSVLVNLRARALDLHARLSELRDSIAMLRDGIGPGRNAPWATFLNKFQALSKLFYQLTEELDRAMTEAGLNNFVVQPKDVAVDPAFVPDLLRTKLELEVERDYDALRREYAADAGDTDDSAVERRTSEFNAFIESALDHFQDRRDELAKPRPTEPPPRRAPQAADAILAALTKGVGLRPS